MQDSLVRFVSSALGLALIGCAAAQPIGPAPVADRGAVTAPGDPPTLPMASPSASNDAASNAAEPGPEVDSGIVTPGTNSVVVRLRAGQNPPEPYPPEPNPPWRRCAQNALYTLNLKTHELTWDFCSVVSERGTRVLAPKEVAALDQALARLKVVKGSGLCPVHAPTISVTTTGNVKREYHVDLCWGDPPVLGVDATQGLLDVLYKATGH